MFMQDIEREEILNRLENIRILHEKTLEELKKHDTRKYRNLVIPKIAPKKPINKREIILAFVQYQEELTVPALVKYLVTDAEYNKEKQVEEKSIYEYIRSLVADQILVVKEGYLFCGDSTKAGLNGTGIAKFITDCLTVKPMTSTQMMREAKDKKIIINANRLRAAVSKMHMDKSIKRLPSTDPHAGWTYTL